MVELELAPVDELEVLVLVDNTTDFLSSVPAGVSPELQALTREGMTRLSGSAICCAHHGLSLVIRVRREGRWRQLLFDAGPEGAAVERNGSRLGVDFAATEEVVVSHGHWDHTGGLPRALELTGAGRGRPRPCHFHPALFRRRGLRRPDGSVLPFEDVPSPAELQSLGAELQPSDRPKLLCDRAVWLSGEISRRTTYEAGFPGHVCWSDAGRWEDEPWLIDEQFLAIQVRDLGLVIFTACSHMGLINVLHHARDHFPSLPLYAAIGGFHLAGANERIIPETVRDLRALGFRRIAPAHCTGWRAVNALVGAFGEEVVAPSAVGKLYRF